MEILLEFSINFRWMDSKRIHLEPKTKTNFRAFFCIFSEIKWYANMLCNMYTRIQLEWKRWNGERQREKSCSHDSWKKRVCLLFW